MEFVRERFRHRNISNIVLYDSCLLQQLNQVQYNTELVQKLPTSSEMPLCSNRIRDTDIDCLHRNAIYTISDREKSSNLIKIQKKPENQSTV